MRRAIDGLSIGNAGDLLHPRRIGEAGMRAVVELAVEEAPASLWRELIHLRFPLYDGPGNDAEMLGAAIVALASLIERRIPTLVCCSNGMSRSPSVCAAAIALVQARDPNEVLAEVTRGAPADVSPYLWAEVIGVLEDCRRAER